MNRHGELGQTLVVNVLALMAMIGFAMLVMDGGSFLLSKRNLQGTADAAALAGVRSFPASSAAEASAQASDYATGRNAEADASVDQVIATETGGTCTIDGVTKVLPPYSVCVTVEREDAGVFLPVFGEDAAEIRASAIASVSQLQLSNNWLPFGVQTSLLDLDNPTTIEITPGARSNNVGGMINLAGNGGAPIVDVITGDEYPSEIGVGDPVDTQTGVVGSIENAFRERLEGNSDAFLDVFGQAADGTWYVKDADSPRLGLMPVAEDTNGVWPLQADASMTVKGLVLVYIGRTDESDSMSQCGSQSCPGTSGRGNSAGNPLKVHLTPVNAPIPDSINGDFGDYDSSSFNPVVYRMTS